MTYTEVIEYLKQNGKRLGLEIETNPLAKDVWSSYCFHYRASNDPGGQALLILAVEEYVKVMEKSSCKDIQH